MNFIESVLKGLEKGFDIRAKEIIEDKCEECPENKNTIWGKIGDAKL